MPVFVQMMQNKIVSFFLGTALNSTNLNNNSLVIWLITCALA